VRHGERDVVGTSSTLHLSRRCHGYGPLTDLRELLDPHAGLQLHVLHVQALGVRGAAVGELHLHGHHVGVGAERLPAEAVLHRQTLAADPVQQLVALHRAGGGKGLQGEEEEEEEEERVDAG